MAIGLGGERHSSGDAEVRGEQGSAKGAMWIGRSVGMRRRGPFTKEEGNGDVGGCSGGGDDGGERRKPLAKAT